MMLLIIWRQRVKISWRVKDEYFKKLLFQENQGIAQNSNQPINPGAYYPQPIAANYGQNYAPLPDHSHNYQQPPNYYHQQQHNMPMGPGGMNNVHQIQPAVSANHSHSSSGGHNNMFNANP